MAESAIGIEIKQTRQCKGLTAMQLAEELPADHTTVFRYEKKGKVKPDTMVRISEVLREPQLLPKYCSGCPVGQARKKYNLKRERPARERTRSLVNKV